MNKNNNSVSSRSNGANAPVSCCLSTDEGNMIIATFCKLDKQIENGETLLPSYEKDFNKMMFVVEHIEQGNYGFKMCRKVVEIYYDDTKQVILKRKERSRKESLWIALVDFIQWLHNGNAPKGSS